MAGILFGKDESELHSSVRIVLNRRQRLGKSELNFAEIGCAAGGTSKSIIRYVNNANDRHEFKLNYYGVDSCDFTGQPPKILEREFKFIKGYSFEKHVLAKMPKQLDWVFIDACHCAFCVKRDTETYAPLLSDIGVLAFHDAAPAFQGLHPQEYGKLYLVHDSKAAQKGVQVLLGLSLVDFPKFGLSLAKKAKNQKEGGVQVYTKFKSKLL